MPRSSKTAQVALSGASYGFDRLYTYECSDSFGDNIKRGMRVLVPFGRGDKKRVGLVVDISNEKSDLKLKPIIQAIDNEPLVDDEALKIIVWLKENTFCTYFDAFKTVIPTGLGINLSVKYSVDESIDTVSLTVEEKDFFQKILEINNEGKLLEYITNEKNKKNKELISTLISKGAIIEDSLLKRRVGDDTVRMVRLSDEYIKEIQDDGNQSTKKLTAKQKSVVDTLLECSTASVKELTYLLGITTAVLNTLKKSGVITFFEYEVVRNPSSEIDNTKKLSDIVLTQEQARVFEGIGEIVDENKPSGVLLRGVTGSGKTSIFIKLIEKALDDGKTAMLLIPEISLTPQMVSKFKSLFGDMVAVINSSLSLGQRVNEYKRVKNGSAKIVIGTRSAVFAPLKNIGLIIMDEEGERTYKSESSPRYHARDVAILRCGEHNATLLMASATPSIESYYFAKKNRYKLFELEQRYKNAILPEVMIIDMEEENSIFSRELVEQINIRLEKKEQIILLLNRRGFHTYITCVDCKKPLSCPNCNIPMTYHKPNNMMMCHYCGYASDNSKICPDCGGDHIRSTGVGTQRAEDELEYLFPDAKILRMDADTTYSKFSYEKNFSAFGRGEYDIMIGTQMIAKGLDFPNVTLVGVLSLDKALYAGDFRSYERTFSLITQVVGRSGRGEKKGAALIQTFTPEHYVLNLAAEQNYVDFYEEEIALRHTLIYPPFCDTCVIGFSSLSDGLTRDASDEFLKLMKKSVVEDKLCIPLRVLGPSKCVHEKINNKYRYRIIIKCKNCVSLRNFIRDNLTRFSKMKAFNKVSVFADINGDLGV